MDQPQSPSIQETPQPNLGRTTAAPTRFHAWLCAGAWSLLALCSLLWNLHQARGDSAQLALSQARMAIDKDIVYRRWSAGLGGVYAIVTPLTPPNPHLQAPERDVSTPSGRQLTLINPAYMTRLVHELARQASGMQGHITSLKPLNPQNAPYPWEAQALRGFEQGQKEASIRVEKEGRPFLRLMRPLPYEASCQACHAQQGYEVGQVRGGISVELPLEHILAAQRQQGNLLLLTHAGLWGLGLAGLVLAWRGLERRQQARLSAEQAREKVLAQLRRALEQVDTLSGLLPICASCKRIRDDEGQWQVMESYISRHSRASFSHGICPRCAQQLYPDLAPQPPNP